MPTYKVLGIYSFSENLKSINIDDSVYLKKEIYNMISKNAIGVYTMDNKKLGYLPIENSDETLYFKNSYKISTIMLNQEYPLLEIVRYYPTTNYLENVEFPLIKKLKYKFKNEKLDNNMEKKILGLYKYLKTQKVIAKNIIVTYKDDNFINIIIETSKGVEKYNTVTFEYFKNNSEKYEEFVEYELLDNAFFRDFLFHRLECYIEQNYASVGDSILDSINLTAHKSDIIHEPEKNINLDDLILYIRYKIDSLYPSIHKYTFIDKVIETYNLQIGKLYYDHKKLIYSYINFISDDLLFEIGFNNNNIITKALLCNKKNVIVYNPKLGSLSHYQL
jgi:hypothetical protein